MIDASIPLQIKQYQPPDQLALLAKANDLQTQQQQQQLNNQKLQTGQLDLNQAQRVDQSQQRAQAAQQATQASLAKNTTVDPTTGLAKVNRGQVISDMATAGFAPEAIGLSSQWAAGDQAAHKTTLDDAKTSLDNQKKDLELHAQVIGPYLQSITPQNPNGDPSLWASAGNTFVQRGWAKPGDIPSTPNPTMAQQIYGQGLSAQQQTAAAQKQIDQAREQGTADATASYQKGELRDAATGNAIKAGELDLNRKKFQAGQLDNGQQLTGDLYLQTLSPGMQSQVKAMANGDIPLPSPSTRSPEAQALRTAVMTYDPTFTQSRYTGKQQFKTGPDAVSIQGGATMLGHLQDSLANSAKVGTAPALDTKFQTPTDAAYMKDVQLYTGEVGKLVTGKALTVDEGDKLLSGLNSWRQDVRDASLNELAKLSQSRIQAGMQKYKTATGQDLPLDEFFDKPTQQNLQKIGVIQGGAAAPSATPAQSGGSSSGLGVKLSDAMTLPQNQGKSQQQVIQDIQAHGHTVIQ